MICPKCKKETIGKWCVYCGESPEEEKEAVSAEYREFDTSPLTPIKSYRDSAEEYLYRDDVSNPGEMADDRYSPEGEGFEAYSYYNRDKKENKAKLVAILTICGCAVLAVMFLMARLLFFGGSQENNGKNIARTSSAEESENKEAAALYEKGEKYLKIRDYDSAEEIYRELSRTADDDEALLLYEIVLNYNRAIKKRESSDYKEAKKIIEKIPVEYVDYAIAEDVDILSDEIDMGISTYETFESVRKYMNSKDFEGADQEAGLLDDNYLSQEDKEEFEKIKAELEKIKEEAKNLSSHEAEDFLMEYCDAMAKAVNNGDFSIVTPYLDQTSAVYNLQRDAVSYCASEGIVKSFDSLRLKELTKTDSKIWTAHVSETETVTYENGTQETKTYDRTYTITYSDSDYYITGIN